jgi:hypothetical protein
MARQAIRTPYPFHAFTQHNPRAHVTCCRPRKLPRRTLWRRLQDEIARLCR